MLDPAYREDRVVQDIATETFKTHEAIAKVTGFQNCTGAVDLVGSPDRLRLSHAMTEQNSSASKCGHFVDESHEAVEPAVHWTSRGLWTGYGCEARRFQVSTRPIPASHPAR